VTLVLQAVDVHGPLRWRWLLTGETAGDPLAVHEVALDEDAPQASAFGDVYGYARSYAAPDRRAADEARLVDELGAWAGRAVLGERVGAAILARAPVTVLVRVPDELRHVRWWPLELAHAGGRPLAASGDVALVYEVPSGDQQEKPAVGQALRMLAVFSQPDGASVLALRRERYELVRLVRRLAARQRRMVRLTVVQYGVTRERLAEIADDGDGWDVLHLSGHGGLGAFLLERQDGSPDLVGTDDLVRLLRPARPRVKLAVVSACQSAADVTAQTLRLIGLPDQAGQVEQAELGEHPGLITGLARALAAELDCAVLAMRYPVTDDFAIAFGAQFYERLLGHAQPAATAAARAAVAAGPAGQPTPSLPALSLGTPGMFGGRAAGLTLPPPRGKPAMDLNEPGLAYFPPEPERFVGRVAAMARASAALAPGSGQTAVLLHGMAGAGKTACALELAYRHRDSFAALAFWQAPDGEFTDALADLAVTLDTQLGDYGFQMTGHLTPPPKLSAFLPRLRQLMSERGLLLVLDNVEPLLTAEGSWRDPRWDQLIAALTGHDGESRVVMTSRVTPAGLGGQTLVLPVHALPLAEAIALARELPNLRALLHADPGPVRPPSTSATATGIDADLGHERDRNRVRRVLRVVQGHPKLMELADAAAVDRDRLDAQLAAAEQAADNDSLDAFFRSSRTTMTPLCSPWC
jgi:CHAT domain-containing protein/AAA ATPase-like protein